jgi:hypothetical protein
LSGRDNPNIVIIFAIEMSARRVHRDKKIHFRSQSAFDEAIVRLVTDDVQFRQRMAKTGVVLI